jgi:GT2 family glycosyltransferase
VSPAPTRISIVVPTHGRPHFLAGCLGGLARLEYPRDRFQAIVVDDGGDGSSDAVVRPFEDRLELELVRQARAGAGAARNAGARRAHGQLLAFIDDDCVPDPGWLRELDSASARAPGHAVGGRTHNGATGNRCSIASQAVMDAFHAYCNGDGSEPRFFASNNVAFPAEQFRAAGGFETTFPYAEDRELCDRWLHLGHRMAFAPDAVVHHLRAPSLAGFWRQHYNYGRGASHFHRARARQGRGRHVPEPGFYPELVRSGRVHARQGGALPLAGLLALSQVANLVGFVAERLAERGGPAGRS